MALVFCVSGRKFGAVLESDLSDGRAALNWGKALCARAQLASSTALLPADEEPDPQVMAAQQPLSAWQALVREQPMRHLKAPNHSCQVQPARLRVSLTTLLQCTPMCCLFAGGRRAYHPPRHTLVHEAGSHVPVSTLQIVNARSWEHLM